MTSNRVCYVCEGKIGGFPKWIGCGTCNRLAHLKCVHLSGVSTDDIGHINWLCTPCYDKVKVLMKEYEIKMSMTEKPNEVSVQIENKIFDDKATAKGRPWPASSRKVEMYMSNLQQQRVMVEQLRREATLTRTPVSEAVEDIKQFVLQHEQEDYLLIGFSTQKNNPFRERASCQLL